MNSESTRMAVYAYFTSSGNAITGLVCTGYIFLFYILLRRFTLLFFFSSGKNVRLAQGFWEFCYNSIAGIRKRMSTVHANSNLVLHTIRIGNLGNFPLASTYYYYYPCPCWKLISIQAMGAASRTMLNSLLAVDNTLDWYLWSHGQQQPANNQPLK